MKKIILFISIICIKQIAAQTWVTIPDANFANWLQANVPSAMSGNQMNISSNAVTSRTGISCYSWNISDLSGVQYFSSLTSLYCYSNNLTSLPPLPPGLTDLHCASNQLTSLPTLPSGLQVLSCENNYLSSLPNIPASVWIIVCAQNQLTTLPTLPNSLTTLYATFNQFSALPPFPPGLNALDIGNNNIRCFPTFPNSLNSFNIDPNPYNCLPNHITAMNSTQWAMPLCGPGNSNGCSTTTGIENFISNSQIILFPNPTSDQFFIDANTNDKLNVDLYDVNGRHVFSASGMDKENINVTTLDNGSYSLTIKTADRVINKKLVILR